ncbi:hypothetical conserved protein [Candidatus Nitrosoglobus terrae]|uniref:Hypothetical conserved protein n=1 Tax=Candidatus Nitrosoglobus terrae TaxID=1630141 RepID=A0A1Q2SNL8_9GAMM|nr:DUF1269 domain-containing protein [Candidatus Nitrosoglobus terrae]BAW80720.1 hypothetical conserved protein [Candidatus Nitrosoglobus terrae]
MRRLYFLIPNVENARKVVDKLLLARVEERHMHAVAKEGIPMEGLPEARFIDTGDLIPALARGGAIGAVTGAVTGFVAVYFSRHEIILDINTVVLVAALAGVFVGGLAASIIGMDTPNSRITRFKQAIAEGQILMMVDVPKNKVDIISDLMKSDHIKIESQGTEPTIPAFP